MASTEPAAKKQKTDEEAKKTTPVATNVEKEEDAPKASGVKVKDAITFHVPDTTMNVMSSTSGKVLFPLTDGGIRHLLSGARASVGVKAGRYMFEAKVVEQVKREEGGKTVKPQHVLKIGLSTSGSSLFLGDTEDSICFDTEGNMIYKNKKTFTGKSRSWAVDGVYALVVNLTGGDNSNTVSLFKDGVRISQPQALPESLVGKTLFPTFTFRNVVVNTNFGTEPMAPLPFTCHMFQEALTKDAEVAKAPAPGIPEVLCPVALPEEGGFDWLDMFLAKNPQYTEISDRAIMDWCKKSGIFGPPSKSSIDKPTLNFGIADLDDLSAKRVLQTVAPLQNRSYVVMELRGNLTKELRTATLDRFPASSFKTVAEIVVGEPATDFKKYTQELNLQKKQAASDIEFKKQQAAEKAKKLAEKRAKDMEKAKKKAEKERKKKLAEIEKAKKAAEAKAAGKEVEEEEKKDEAEEEEEEEEEVEMVVDETNEEPPKVTLTAEEKKQVFRSADVPDMVDTVLNTNLTKFTLPEKDEGFAEIRYAWTKSIKATEYFKKWVLEKKQRTRIEDLNPGQDFLKAQNKFKTEVATWQAKLKAYKAAVTRKAQEKMAKAAKKAAAEKAAAAKAAAAKAAAAKAAAEGKEVEQKEEEKKEDVVMVEEEEEEEEEVDFANLDIFGLEDVSDVGGGMPLVNEWTDDDWTLMNLAFELHTLPHAFKKDANDPERGGMHTDHVAFYYNKYFKKALNFKSYGVENLEELVALVKHCVYIKDSCLESFLQETMESFQVFVKIIEETRRRRAIMVDMGEESAKLKFAKTPLAAPTAGGKAGNKGMDKGGGKGKGKSAGAAFGKAGGKGGWSQSWW